MDVSKCLCCGKEDRLPGNKYGVECKRSLNNLTNHEKKQGEADGERKKRFDRIRKEGGPELHALLLAYQRECQKSQRRGKARGNIDIMRVLEQWRSENYTHGQRLLLMPLSRWLREGQTNRGLSVAGAQAQWDEKEKQYRKGALGSKYWRKEGSALWLAMPSEEYVDEGHSDKHVGTVEAQLKQKKKPDEADFAEAGKQVSLSEVPPTIMFGAAASPRTPPRQKRSRDESGVDLPSTEKNREPQDPSDKANKRRCGGCLFLCFLTGFLTVTVQPIKPSI